MSPQLKKVLQQLSPEQQAEYFALYANQDQFINRSTSLRRMSLQLSGNLTNEEVRQAISDAFGFPLNAIPPVDFTRRQDEIRADKKNVGEIIAIYKQFLTQKGANKDKYDELLDLGRFIYSINDDIGILIPQELLEYPDFQIIKGKETIGVEHTRLIDKQQIMAFKTAKYILKEAEQSLTPAFGETGKTMNIFFNYDSTISRQGNFKDGGISINERKALINAVEGYVKSILIGDSGKPPAFITRIQISENKEGKLYLELGQNYLTSRIFIEQLFECIAKKEIKANRYRSAMSNKTLWLLIVVDDINSFSGFDIAATKLPILAFSNFDKVFLFEKFDGVAYLLTDNQEKYK